METGNIKQALCELKQMMNMPMKCYTPAQQKPESQLSPAAPDENTDPQVNTKPLKHHSC